MSNTEKQGVPLTIFVEERHGISRTNQPMRVGVPLPRNYLRADASVTLRKEGAALPLQTRPLALWPDGSVKWLLLDFFLTIAPNKRLALALERGASPPFSLPVTVLLEENMLTVDNGLMSCSVDCHQDIFFSSIQIGDVKLLAEKGCHVRLLDRTGQHLALQDVVWEVEERGPLRITCRSKGCFIARGQRKKKIVVSARHTVYAGQQVVVSEITVHNPDAARHPGGLWDLGDAGSFFFRELSICWKSAHPSDLARWQLETEGAIEHAPTTSWQLYQDSSGGDHWDCVNHVDCHGKVTTRFSGYRWRMNHSSQDSWAGNGQRATPWVSMRSGGWWLGGTLLHFWQNFPKSLEIDDGRLIFGLFPSQSGQLYELQGGERKRHTLFFAVGDNGQESLLSAFQHELTIYPDPQWVENSGAIPFFVAENNDPNYDYLAYVKNCIDGEHSFYVKREMIDEYGWRNFGDIYADHEAVHHRGTQPFISHYNNQYDFIFGALVHFLRSGDQRWWSLAMPAARHMMDIDIYHTDRDRAVYNGGQFWHTDHYKEAGRSTHRTYSRDMQSAHSADVIGGGPSNENNYASGLLLYYYLTGDSNAAAAVEELATWVVTMDSGSHSLFCLFDHGSSGLASQTVTPDFHKPGRGAGNSINTLLDAFLLTGHYHFLAKAEELIRRCIHPDDDIVELGLEYPEYRWSYLVFLQVLGKYLELKKTAGAFDYNYWYAVHSLLHYAEWMHDHEVPYQDVLDRVEIPTETWPAQDIRKALVFHFAARYQRSDRIREQYTKKAGFFFKRCLEDLSRYETRFCTRPLVLLTVYGFPNAFFQKNGQQISDIPSYCPYSFGMPLSYIPQRYRFRQTAARHLRTTFGELRRLIVAKCMLLARKIGLWRS